jgi:hypothetical protein
MKRAIGVALAAVIFAILAVVYGLSPYSWSTSHIKVSLVEKEYGGHQAVLQNTGILPVKVVGCEFISDTNERNLVVISDVIQRKQPNIVIVGDVVQRGVPGEIWENELVRNGCEGGKSRTQLLWPHQRIFSSPFFANVGIGKAFQHQDIVRFLLFPHGMNREVDTLSSEPFRVDNVGKLP